MNKNLINFLISIRNASLAKKSILKIKNLKVLSNYITILYQEGLIQSYSIQTVKGIEYLVIHLRTFENKVITENLKLLSQPSKIKVLSYTDLLKLNLKNKTFVLSTSKGIVAHKDCLKQKLGGVAIFSC
jgi:small subunit ribosomal protein S8